MFYVYVLLLPVLILSIGYAVVKHKLKRYSEYVNFLLVVLLVEWVYAFIMYYLEIRALVNMGWVFYTLFMFLVPITAIAFILKIVEWIKGKRAVKHSH